MEGRKIALAVAGVAALAVAGLAGASVYFYRRTMIRSNAKVERTMKMSGTDWSKYSDMLAERKERLFSQPYEDVYQTSADGLRLHALFFPRGDKKKVVICFHGYTSSCRSDYIALSDYYIRKGFSMLLVDARAHGESEGTYVGFGCLDRKDALGWVRWVINICGADAQILLHGDSMGASTVLMAAGMGLPNQVKGLVSDCAFTSPKEVFTHVLHTMYHLPAFPIIPIADQMNRRLAGYGMDECNAAREAEKIQIPVLFVHGSADTFVPTEMCYKIYESCRSKKRLLIVAGAAHAESYYKDMPAYEEALSWLIESCLDSTSHSADWLGADA